MCRRHSLKTGFVWIEVTYFKETCSKVAMHCCNCVTSNHKPSGRSTLSVMSSDWSADSLCGCTSAGFCNDCCSLEKLLCSVRAGCEDEYSVKSTSIYRSLHSSTALTSASSTVSITFRVFCCFLKINRKSLTSQDLGNKE